MLRNYRRSSIYAVSASIGSGKTRAAIQYMASTETVSQNFLYVAPTIRLISQTASDLEAHLGRRAGGPIRNVHLIHTESRLNDEVPTSAETLSVLNESAGNIGKIVLITTKTFLAILPSINKKENWRVILDEAFSPITFQKFFLGKDIRDGWDYFREIFQIDPNDNYRVVPAPGKAARVAEIASGNVKLAGQKFQGIKGFAQDVDNPAIRCELVMTLKTTALLDGAIDMESGLSERGTDSVLLIASYVTPEHFEPFQEVIIMSALFRHTMLYHLWTRLFGIRFQEHPSFNKRTLRDIHKEQGKHVAIGHLLHKEDRSSKRNLSRNCHTAEIAEREPGLRVLDRAISLAAEYLKGSPFLLQVNNGYGYEPGMSFVPANAIPIPAMAHGLNSFQDVNNVVALAVTNPIPQEADWIMTRTGLSQEDAMRAYRIHTVYQAVGRSSVRKATQDRNRKIFLTAGYDDAWMLHGLFEGSTWLGQVGDLEAMSQLSKTGKEGGLITDTAEKIRLYLTSLSADIARISSRRVKAAIGADCTSRSWSKASFLVSQNDPEWTMEAQSFVRRDYRYYFGDTEDLAA